jgi:D-amino peptidase
MKIYILTDMEGVAGVVDWENFANPGARYYEKACELLVGEINAAIEGALEAGVKEVVVLAGHGGSTSIKIDQLHPAAKLVSGVWTYPAGLDQSYDAMFLIGNHSMEGTYDGNMNHTFSSHHIQQMKLNGRAIGEIGMTAGLAGWFNVPTVLVSGDEAACREARAIIPDILTAPVKKGLSQFCAMSLQPQKARELIKEKARLAVSRIKKIKPYKVKPPYKLDVEFRTTEGVSWRLGKKGIQKVNAKTIRVTGNDFIEIMRSW